MNSVNYGLVYEFTNWLVRCPKCLTEERYDQDPEGQIVACICGEQYSIDEHNTNEDVFE